MKTKTPFPFLAAALLAALAAGCASTPEPPTEIGPNGEPQPALTSREERQVAITTPTKPEFTVSEAAELLRVKLAVTAEDQASAAFADGIHETAVTALRDRKVKIVDDGKEDLELSFRAGRKVFNEAPADYVTLDGTVSARLADALKGGVLAERTFRGRNKPALGADAASVALAGEVAGEVSKWIAETVVPGQIPLESRTVRIARLNNYKPGEAAFANQFVKDVVAMDGVLRCEAAAVDPVAHTAEFRVLYRRMSFPQGFVNAVIAAHPEYEFSLK